MPKVRRILKHVEIQTARGTRRCRRNREHSIAAGEPCLVIQDDAGPFTRNYCRECALPILKQCASDLRHFRNALYGPVPTIERPIPASSELGKVLLDANRQRCGGKRRPNFRLAVYEADGASSPSSLRPPSRRKAS